MMSGFLSRSIPFDLAHLQQRYDAELRCQLCRPDREDLTVKLWMKTLSERDGGRGRSRTDMRLPSADFESAVAANFTTRP